MSDLASRLRSHVTTLATQIGPRHVGRPRALAQARNYLAAQLNGCGLDARAHEYTAHGVPVANIEAELPGAAPAAPIVIVGAHYDSIPGCPGANDNGSGVAAMLELARAVPRTAGHCTIRFVAFVNEEPPFFQTDTMGSYVYARRSKERGERIAGMLSIETIGFYSDEEQSQQYPPLFDGLFPPVGNFLGAVGNLRSIRLLQQIDRAFRAGCSLPMIAAPAPEGVAGVAWSDHWSFWQHGYPAVMLTDTAPFRYPHYHAPTDTPDKLDYARFAEATVGLTAVVNALRQR